MRTHMKKGGNAGGTTAVGGAVGASGDSEKAQSVAKVLTPVRNLIHIVCMYV